MDAENKADDCFTAKRDYKDGYYYPAQCPRCGNKPAAYLRGGRNFTCSGCNNAEGVKPRVGRGC